MPSLLDPMRRGRLVPVLPGALSVTSSLQRPCGCVLLNRHRVLEGLVHAAVAGARPSGRKRGERGRQRQWLNCSSAPNRLIRRFRLRGRTALNEQERCGPCS